MWAGADADPRLWRDIVQRGGQVLQVCASLQLSMGTAANVAAARIPSTAPDSQAHSLPVAVTDGQQDHPCEIATVQQQASFAFKDAACGLFRCEVITNPKGRVLAFEESL